MYAQPPSVLLRSEGDVQAGIFFADRAEGCVQASLGPGSTLLIPASWPHAVVTQEDAVVVGGNFLHALELRCGPHSEKYLLAEEDAACGIEIRLGEEVF